MTSVIASPTLRGRLAMAIASVAVLMAECENIERTNPKPAMRAVVNSLNSWLMRAVTTIDDKDDAVILSSLAVMDEWTKRAKIPGGPIDVGEFFRGLTRLECVEK